MSSSVVLSRFHVGSGIDDSLIFQGRCIFCLGQNLYYELTIRKCFIFFISLLGDNTGKCFVSGFVCCLGSGYL